MERPFVNHGQPAQPFDTQLRRGSSVLQQAASQPLKSFSKEEELHARIQDAEIEAEAARKAVYQLQKRLAEEVGEHTTLKVKYQQLESACRRLNCLPQVNAEVERYVRHQFESENCQDVFQNGAAGKDIRVHGGSGNLNKFAFGSDRLQQLVDEHSNEVRLSHHRRSSFDQDTQQSLCQQPKREHYNRQSMLDPKSGTNDTVDNNKYDIFGNVVTERSAPQQQPTQPETDHIFRGMGLQQQAGASRQESDLRADKHFANAKLWRGGNSSLSRLSHKLDEA